MNIILPKTYVPENKRPVIFLLGPIRSAPVWQDDAVDYFLQMAGEILIANPRRDVKDVLKHYVVRGNETYFARQRAWEWHYQDLAAVNGVLMFWLPKEAQHSCDKSYGLMTSNEFGHWTAIYQNRNMNNNKNINLVIGTDGEFNEWKTFAYDLERKAPDIKVHHNLEDTCKQALALIR